MTLPKKGQKWLNQDKQELRIKGVGRGLVSYDVLTTGGVGMCELMYFLNRHCRLTRAMKAGLKQEKRRAD